MNLQGDKTCFKHSVPVPRIYKVASKIAKNVKEGKDSLKNLVYQEKHVNIKSVYALIVETFKREDTIDDLIRKSQLFIKEPRFNHWLAKILICEMLWGMNKMTGESRPVQTILEYENILRELLLNCEDTSKDILKHNNVHKPRYVRVNTLKMSMEDAVNNFREEGWNLVSFLDKTNYSGFLEKLTNLQENEFMVDIHVKDLLIFPPKTEFHRHQAYKSRYIILQDKASCLPVQLLNPSPDSTIIDMCAAPGMKTTQLAAVVKDTGVVYAVEMDRNREKVLRQFVESTGAKCVKTVLRDVMQVTDTDCPGIEYVLVDPSCSGSGITDRVEVEDQSFPNKMQRLRKLCSFQAKLLRHATTAFPNAKRIVYSTCSINSEENEDVVRQVLETCKHFKLVDAKKLLHSWNDSGSEVFPEFGKMCVYATPENDKTNGFFIAVLERLENGEKNPHLNVQLCKMFEKKAKEKRKFHSEDDIRNYNVDRKDDKSNIKREIEDNSYIKESIDNENMEQGNNIKQESFDEKEDSIIYSSNIRSKKHKKEIKCEVDEIEQIKVNNDGSRKIKRNKKIKLEQVSDLEEVKSEPDVHTQVSHSNEQKCKKMKLELISEQIKSEPILPEDGEVSINMCDIPKSTSRKKKEKSSGQFKDLVTINESNESPITKSSEKTNFHKSKKKVKTEIMEGNRREKCEEVENIRMLEFDAENTKKKKKKSHDSSEVEGTYKIHKKIKIEEVSDIQLLEEISENMDTCEVSQSRKKKHKKNKYNEGIEKKNNQEEIYIETCEVDKLENNEENTLYVSKKKKRRKELQDNSLINSDQNNDLSRFDDVENEKRRIKIKKETHNQAEHMNYNECVVGETSKEKRKARKKKEFVQEN